MESSPRTVYYDAHGRPTYAPSIADPHVVHNLTKELQDLEFGKIQAEKKAIHYREEAVEAKESLHREKRRSQIERRERELVDKERQQQYKRIGDIPANPPRDVVVIQPRPPVRYDPGTDAHNRAKEDFKKKRGGYNN